jgi:redox-sensing transcriptional repressor
LSPKPTGNSNKRDSQPGDPDVHPENRGEQKPIPPGKAPADEGGKQAGSDVESRSTQKGSCEGEVSRHEAARDEASAIPHDLPQPAVGRLSLYYRELRRMLDSEIGSVNSQELGRMVDVSPAVVRRDLSALGTIGRRGVGYDVGVLIESIGRVLGSGVQWRVVLVGVGSLGHALLRYRGFQRLGFQLSAAFDKDPARIGTSIGGITIRDVDDLEATLTERPAELAMLAVPAEHAAEIAARLVGCGISGILNFAPTTLRLRGEVAVVNVDLASELQRLAFTVHTKKSP